jgi:DnaK suppressor protein
MKKGEPAVMDEESYRSELLERRERVLGRLGAKFDTLAGMGRVAEDDRAQISHEEFISLQRNSLDYLQLRLVDEALTRLGAGTFGACQACGEPIAVKRLLALPWARYCLSCQDTVGQEMDKAWRTGRSRVPVPA